MTTISSMTGKESVKHQILMSVIGMIDPDTQRQVIEAYIQKTKNGFKLRLVWS